MEKNRKIKDKESLPERGWLQYHLAVNRCQDHRSVKSRFTKFLFTYTDAQRTKTQNIQKWLIHYLNHLHANVYKKHTMG